MLIFFDFVDGGKYTVLVEAGQHSHGENARLVAEHRPSEVLHLVEDDEADDADDEVDGSGGQKQPHPRPDGSEMWFVERVEVLQTLDCHLDFDVADPGVCHAQDDDEQSDDRLDDAVSQVNVFRFFDVSQVQRFLCSFTSMSISVSILKLDRVVQKFGTL